MIRKALPAVLSTIDNLCKALVAIPAAFAIIMTVTVAVNVVLRYAFNSPLEWEYEMVESMLLTFAWLPLAYVFSQGREISITFLSSRFSQRTRLIIRIVGLAIGVYFFGVITRVVLGMSLESFAAGTRSVYASRFPIGPLQLVVVIGAGALCLQLLVLIGRCISSLKSGRSPEKQPAAH